MTTKNRLALVTGGTGGIGTEICRTLAKQGCRVVAGFNGGGGSEKALLWQRQQQEAGFDVEIAYGDVSNFESAGAMVEQVESQCGPIDILVNNAGITRDATLRKMSALDWEAVLRINLDSVFNVTKQVIEGMVTRRFGRIVSISSVNGQKGQFGQANYSAAKAGMYGFTKALAQEVASKGITVNTVSPGYVDTPMVRKVSEPVLQQIVAQIPVGRLAFPSEIARVVAFLVAEEAAYITGSNIAVNGGMHLF